MERKFIYVHFNVRRPKGKNYGIFSIALYGDKEGRRIIAQRTLALELWKDNQHIASIQSLEYALYNCYKWQKDIMDCGFTNILLVTNNSVLAGWIQNPKKNTKYRDTMLKAMEPYKVGGVREIALPIGLCDDTVKELAHKFCREDLIMNKSDIDNKKEVNVKTIYDVIEDSRPEIS